MLGQECLGILQAAAEQQAEVIHPGRGLRVRGRGVPSTRTAKPRCSRICSCVFP